MSDSKRSTILPYILLLLATVFWSGNNIATWIRARHGNPWRIDFKFMAAQSSNAKLNSWVAQWAKVLQPDDIYWCDGSQNEYD